jgi:hypothetical protein
MFSYRINRIFSHNNNCLHCKVVSNTRIIMKKILLILFIAIGSVTFGQKVSPTVDTLRFRIGMGKIFQLITYGTSHDSITINGIKYYCQGGPESDPVWISDSADYLKSATAMNVYATIAHTQSQSTVIGLVDSIAHRIPLHLQTTSTNKDTTIYLHNGVYYTSTNPVTTRYSAYSSGDTYVGVVATGTGITAAYTAGELTFTIPTGVLLQSIKVRVSGLSSLIIYLGRADIYQQYKLGVKIPGNN